MQASDLIRSQNAREYIQDWNEIRNQISEVVAQSNYGRNFSVLKKTSLVALSLVVIGALSLSVITLAPAFAFITVTVMTGKATFALLTYVVLNRLETKDKDHLKMEYQVLIRRALDESSSLEIQNSFFEIEYSRYRNAISVSYNYQTKDMVGGIKCYVLYHEPSYVEFSEMNFSLPNNFLGIQNLDQFKEMFINERLKQF